MGFGLRVLSGFSGTAGDPAHGREIRDGVSFQKRKRCSGELLKRRT